MPKKVLILESCRSKRQYVTTDDELDVLCTERGGPGMRITKDAPVKCVNTVFIQAICEKCNKGYAATGPSGSGWPPCPRCDPSDDWNYYGEK